MKNDRLKVMVLAGGPDRERAVSLMSAAEVSAALTEAGHDVRVRDAGPGDFSGLDEMARWSGDVLFSVLHGSWGEGGALQRELDRRGVPYVGSSAGAAELCMDKHRTKLVLLDHDLPTPPHELVGVRDKTSMSPPVVIKPLCEGSSIDLWICRCLDRIQAARAELQPRHAQLLIERFVSGRELTVGIIEEGGGSRALPPIHIVPATEFYDYEAKYHRDDTQYRFDLDLPEPLIDQLQAVAAKAHRVLGCRHLSRVDFILDEQLNPWILEVNTIPGFTRHSLVPMAADRAGIPMPKLVDQLVRMAIR